MPIVVPSVGTEIDVAGFGKPVVDEINRLTTVVNASFIESVQLYALPGIDILAGANTDIFDRSYTMPAAYGGIAFCVVINADTVAQPGDIAAYNAAAVQIAGNTLVPPGPNTSTMQGVIPLVSGVARLRLSIFAWAGGAIHVRGGNYSTIMVWPVKQIIATGASAFP